MAGHQSILLTLSYLLTHRVIKSDATRHAYGTCFAARPSTGAYALASFLPRVCGLFNINYTQHVVVGRSTEHIYLCSLNQTLPRKTSHIAYEDIDESHRHPRRGTRLVRGTNMRRGGICSDPFINSVVGQQVALSEWVDLFVNNGYI